MTSLCNEGKSNENKAEVEIDDIKVDDYLLMQDNDLGLKEDDWNKMMMKSKDNDLDLEEDHDERIMLI